MHTEMVVPAVCILSIDVHCRAAFAILYCYCYRQSDTQQKFSTSFTSKYLSATGLLDAPGLLARAPDGLSFLKKRIQQLTKHNGVSISKPTKGGTAGIDWARSDAASTGKRPWRSIISLGLKLEGTPSLTEASGLSLPFVVGRFWVGAMLVDELGYRGSNRTPEAMETYMLSWNTQRNREERVQPAFQADVSCVETIDSELALSNYESLATLYGLLDLKH
ncbi:hypothetical protein BKA70DRAFT_1221524 [Coprinopsis sp. MPI-PUGE-AT-0042]|nr:hypothetical protein BKA70DRAFT_1221524 [Coprinopsis sp. MPI-PUGE-AT-0042]